MDDIQAVTLVKSDLTWLQRHERLIICTLVLVAVVLLGQHWLNNSAANDKQVANTAAAQLADQKTANTQIAQQVQALATEYQAVVDTVSRQNAALASAVASRNSGLVAQQSQDKTLPLDGVAARWRTLASLDTTDVQPTASGIAVTDNGARQTVSQLEQVPVLVQNLHDEQEVSDNRQSQLVSANDVIGGLNTQVSGLQATVKAQDVACKTEIASVKADARKSKWRWFKGGFISGFIGGVFVGHAIP